MSRTRLTHAAREAAAPPANPNEGPAHPAHKPDPEASQYENGDTSSWAEDPTTGPYPNGAHPATPDEGPASPAYKAAALEARAAKCIRLATHMLGEPGEDPVKVAAIEAQALTLMDLSDEAIKASLKRAGEDESDEDEEESSKKASISKAAAEKIASNEARIARLERILIRLAEDEEEEVEEEIEEAEEESSKKKAYDEEAMLEAMLSEEGMMGDMGEEAMLESMLREEGMDEEACGGDMPEAMESEEMESMEIEMGGDIDDPMGVMATELDAGEQQVLASLYGEQGATKEASADDGVRLRPQPKKASQGARKLGGPVAKEASSDVQSLESLWKTAPDVSDHF